MPYLARSQAKRQFFEGQSVVFLKPCPVKLNAGIGFSAGGNIAMSSKAGIGILQLQLRNKLLQCAVLRVLKWRIAITLELYSQGKVIAPLAPFKLRSASVPCPMLSRNKLNHAPGAGNQKMTGDLLIGNLCKVGMCLGIQLVLKKINNVLGAVLGFKLPWRQTDVMQNN